MSNYTKSTNFATKDNLTPGDPLKVVRGTEIDTEFNNIATAVATKTDNSAAAITGGAIDGATVGATTPATGSFTTLAASGTTTLAGALVGAVTQAAFNTVSTTLNVGGAATAVNLGAATGTTTVNNTTLAAKAITASTTLAVTGTSTLTGAVTATAGVTGPITSSSVSITGGSITGITDLAVADGGTGASTAAGGLNNLLPSQTSNANKYLQTDGTNASWDAVSLSTADITGTLGVANGGTGVTTSTGTTNVVLSNSPTLVTPNLGVPSFATLTSATGLPISTGVSGLGTGIATALAVNTGSAGAPVLFNGALGTPSSGTVTNLTGTASININGTVGATTATTGAFTSLTASTTLGVTGVATFSAGTLSLPAITTTGDTNTGIFFPAADTVATTVGGVEGTRLTSAGRFGIGTSSPFGILHTNETNGINYFESPGVSSIALQFKTNSANRYLIGIPSASADLQFLAGGTTETMRLTSTGNVGIGTLSPAYKLDVTGTINSGASTPTGYNLVFRTSGITTGRAQTNLTNTSGNLATGVEGSSGGASYTGTAAYSSYIATDGANPFYVITNSAIRATFDSSGNLGLGVTPNASWGSTQRVFELAGASTATILAYVNGLNIGTNYYVNSGGNAVYTTTGQFATKYNQTTTGQHQWFSAASGTAGNTFTFTQAMTLDASGNLGVGTTGGTDRLYVERNFNGSTWVRVNNTDTGSGAAAGVIFKNDIGDHGAISSLSAANSPASSLFMRTFGAYPVTFGTNNTERARITSGGYFKASNAGTYQNSTGSFHELRSSTTSNLIADLRHTDSSNPFGMIIGFTAATPNGTSNYFLNCVDSTAQRAEIRSNGGLANYSANDVNLSDRREKTNFAPATSYLDKICAIPVQTFNYIDQNMEDDSGLTLGVVAQDVQAVAPELVMESNWGTKEEPKMRLSIYQTDLQYALMKCIQEQQALIVSLKARLDAANL